MNNYPLVPVHIPNTVLDSYASTFMREVVTLCGELASRGYQTDGVELRVERRFMERAVGALSGPPPQNNFSSLNLVGFETFQFVTALGQVVVRSTRIPYHQSTSPRPWWPVLRPLATVLDKIQDDLAVLTAWNKIFPTRVDDMAVLLPESNSAWALGRELLLPRPPVRGRVVGVEVSEVSPSLPLGSESVRVRWVPVPDRVWLHSVGDGREAQHLTNFSNVKFGSFALPKPRKTDAQLNHEELVARRREEAEW